MLPTPHSPRGASSASRWMKCPGGQLLIDAMKAKGEGERREEPDYLVDGVEAHRLAAFCLENEIDCWEAPPEDYPDLTSEMMEAVQVYLNYVRSLPGDFFVEYQIHRPEFHELFYGTLDFGAIGKTSGLHIVDYKHGAGVPVEIVENTQLMYYAYGFIDEVADDFDDDEPVTLTIVQPRCHHPDGSVRTWTTTVGHIRQWALTTLRPAMDNHASEFAAGEHCRFCPAKLICPKMGQIADTMLAVKLEEIDALPEMTEERLSSLMANVSILKMLINALEGETYRRLMQGTPVEGYKLVNKITHRAWKDTAQEKLVETFGEEAWKPQSLRTPPQIEALPGGKAFVARYAYTPEGGLTVAPAMDRRKAQKPMTDGEVFANVQVD